MSISRQGNRSARVGVARGVWVAAALFIACGGRAAEGGDADGSVGGAAVGTVEPVQGGSAFIGARPAAGRSHAGGGGLPAGTAATGTGGEAPATAGAPPTANVGGQGSGGEGEMTGGAGGEAADPSCHVNGEIHLPGERWSMGCQLCTCAADGGTYSCDDKLCRVVCIRIAKSFAQLRSQASQCDAADASACTRFVGPANLGCGCAVPYALDLGADAEALRKRYATYGCGAEAPTCNCDEWNTGYCNEGRCAP